MSQPDQLFWGSVILCICAILHVGMLALAISILERVDNALVKLTLAVRVALFTGVAFAVIVTSHTMQVWLWASTFLNWGAIDYFYDALYFSLVTYTTVGYGDITLPVTFRVYGAFAGVTGILCFGVSTAFLVALLGRLVPPR